MSDENTSGQGAHDPANPPVGNAANDDNQNPINPNDLLEQKRAANAEAKKFRQANKALMAELDALKAKVQEQDDAKKSELEKAIERASKLEQAQKDLEYKIQKKDKEMLALRSGANDPEYFAFKLDQALASDPDLNVDEWITKTKEANPIWFGEQKTITKTAAGGINPTRGHVDTTRERVAQIEKDIQEIRKDPFNRDKDYQIMTLFREKQALMHELATNNRE